MSGTQTGTRVAGSVAFLSHLLYIAAC